jgi:integrase
MKYSRHKTGQAYTRVAGRCIYLGRWDSPESHAKFQNLQSGGTLGLSDKTTIAELVTTFLARNTSEYSKESREPAQIGNALASLVKTCGTIRAADFTAAHLDETRKAMALRCSRRVVNRNLGRIKLFFKRCELWGIVPPGVYARLAVVTGQSTRARMTPDREPARWQDVLELVRFLGKPPRGWWKKRAACLKAMVLLLWWSCARPGEIRVFRWQDVDTTGPVWVYRPHKHKNLWRGQTREIFLGPKCQAVLKAFRDAQGFVFRSERSRGAYSEWGLANAIREACIGAGVRFTLYQLRHAAKRRIENAAGEAAAKAMLGQASLEATRKYARSQDGELARKVARVAG